MEEILESYNKLDNTAYVEFLRKYTTKQLTTIILKTPRQCDDPAVFIVAVLSGITCDTKVETDRRLDVFLCGLQIVLENVLDSSKMSKVLSVLLMEVSRFPTAALVQLYEKLKKIAIDADVMPGKWLELISRVIDHLSTQEGVVINIEKLSGEKFLGKAIHELCYTKWGPKYVTSIATIFNDLTLSSDQLKFVITSFLEKMEDLPLDSIPPLVYQLHLLCAKGHKHLFLKGLLKFFDEKERTVQEDKQNPESEELFAKESEECKLTDLRQTEGNVLLHLFYCVKSDQELGQEVVKWLKANCVWPNNILTLFSMSLAFCVASMLPFQKQIFESLKVAILQHYRETITRKSSFRVRKLVPTSPCINETIVSIIESIAGWDHITQGLVEFGFFLLDSFGAVNSQGKTNKDVTTASKQMACSLGSSMILTTFRVNRDVRIVIINNILNSIALTDVAPSRHYIKLLSDSIRYSSRDYHQSITKVGELLDYLVLLPTALAIDFLNAIQPLLTWNSSLRNSVMLVLRKLMFYKEISARKTAVNGSLVCLKNFRNLGRISSQSSQSYTDSASQQHLADIHLPSHSVNNEVLSLELLNMLRRCLSQQAELRVQLYLGFPVILKQNSFLIDTILDLLLAQANIVIEVGANPPIRLELCTQSRGSEIIYMEPVPYLVRCIHYCLSFAKSNYQTANNDQDDTMNLWSHPLVSLLEDFKSAMIKMEVEDFDLDQAVEFSPQPCSGNRHLFFGQMICGIYEALIEHTFFYEGYTSSMSENVIELYARLKRLTAVLKEKAASNNPKKKKDAPLAEKEKVAKSSTFNQSQDCLYSANFLTAILKLILEDESSENQEVAMELKRQTDFIAHIISSVEDKISKVQEMDCFDSLIDRNVDEAFNFFCAVGKSVLHGLLGSGDSINKTPNQVALEIKLLECLQAIFDAVTNIFSEKLSLFYSKLVKKNTTLVNDTENSLGVIVKKLQELTTDLVSDANAKQKQKQLGYLLNIMTSLLEHISDDSPHLSELLQWVENLCFVHTVDDIGTTKHIFTFFLKVSKQFSNHTKILMTISEDVHLTLGEIQQESSEYNGTVKYSLITEMNASSIAQVVIPFIDSFLRDIEWLITKMKANCELQIKDQNEVNQEMQKWGKTVCSGMAIVTTCGYHLLVADIPSGLCRESVIRLITHYYLTLQELTKYFTMLSKLPDSPLPNSFAKLVEHINSKLTQQVYVLLAALNQENEDAPRGKRKRNDASVVSKAVKESRLMPTLIYNIEQYERFIIRLTKLSKLDLTSSLKRSTNRDFRINHALVNASNEDPDQKDKDVTIDNMTHSDINVTSSHNSTTVSSQTSVTRSSGQPPEKRLKLNNKRRNMATKKLVQQ